MRLPLRLAADHTSSAIRQNYSWKAPNHCSVQLMMRGSQTMASITEIAEKFFVACDDGKGWEGCNAYCKPDATFSVQAEPLADIENLEQYTDWMKGLLTIMPDGRYELKSLATDEARQSVCAYGVFSGTHTGEGGPCPPTGKSMQNDYVYVMEFEGDKIRHMTKIWHAGLAMKALGWV